MPPKLESLAFRQKLFYMDERGNEIKVADGLPELTTLEGDETTISYDKMYDGTIRKREYYGFDPSVSEASISAKIVCSSSTTGPSINCTREDLSSVFAMDDVAEQAKEAVAKASESKFFDILKRALDAAFANGEYCLEYSEDGFYSIKRKEKVTNPMATMKIDYPTTHTSKKNETNPNEKKEERVIRPGVGSGYAYLVKKIVCNPPALIVFWGDDTTTVVKCAENETFNAYHGFCAALAKKVYGCNNRVNKIVGGAIREKSKDEKKELKKRAAEAKKKAEEAKKMPSTKKPTSKKTPSTKKPATKKTPAPKRIRKEVAKK